MVKGEETGVRGEAGSAAGRKEGEEREGHCTLATEVKELSEDIENDLCQLWDVSMNEVSLCKLCAYSSAMMMEVIACDTQACANRQAQSI